MKEKEREKINNVWKRLLVLYEILEMSRNTLLFDKVLKPDQVGIVLAGVTEETAKLVCEIRKLLRENSKV